MATSCQLLNHVHVKGTLLGRIPKKTNRIEGLWYPSRRNPCRHIQAPHYSTSFPIVAALLNLDPVPSHANISANSFPAHGFLDNMNLIISPKSEFIRNILLADLDPATAKLAITILGPGLSAFGFLFILRIVMSWYPKLPVGKFPYVIAYAPTEPLLVQTRKVIPPVGGVDVTPVVWFGLLSFLNEILVGPQGLLVLLSQQQVS